MTHHHPSTRLIGSWLVPALLALVLGGCLPLPIRHGTEFVVVIEAPAAGQPGQAQALERMRTVLRDRLRALGVRCTIATDAPGRLLVKVPELTAADLAAVRQAVSRPGRLEFRRVWPGAVPDTAEPGDLPAGYEDMTLRTRYNGMPVVERIYVKRIPEMTGEALSRATVTHDDFGRPQITLEFTHDGATRFGVVTRALAEEGRAAGTRTRLAIVIDGELLSAPVVMEEISGGRAQITGAFTEREAAELAAALNHPLDVPHHVVEERKF